MSYVLAGAAVVTAGVGVYKAVKGSQQANEAKRLAKNNIFHPEEMPYEVGLGTDLAARNYTNGMPGTAEATGNINRNADSAYYRGSQGATSGGDLLDLATRIGYGTNLATNQLGAQEAQYKSGALGEYENALGNQASWRDRLYKNNTLQPYLRTANLAASMYGAGQQNLYSGLDDIASSAVGYATASKGFGSSGGGKQQTFGEAGGSPELTAAGGSFQPPANSGIYGNTPIVPYKIPQQQLDYNDWLNFSTSGGNTNTFK